jgi:WD40 repeat protein/serine/threonine protein kinase
MENLQGTVLKGYTLEERIGHGGFGAVYRAKQPTVGREVAVKIILPSYANNPDFIRRFEAEAHLVARLEHPHISPLYDFWRDPSGAYLVMRYLRGGSVRQSLMEGAFELNAVSQLLDQIASALDFAHRNEVIHRDIKPENILLDEDGNAYLADFGIAKDLAEISGSQTGANAVVGSLDYISPEQARSEPVSPRTDIYSLGVTIYELITGEHPFKNASAIERLYKHINDPLPTIVHLPDDVCADVNAIIHKATAKDPQHRYTDVIALAIAFREGIGRGSTQQDANIVEQLTMREQEILSMIAHGKSNRDIADELVISIGTVKWHITQVYKKLGVRSRVQAIVRARELNLIVTNDGWTDMVLDQLQEATVISLPEPENPYKGLHAFQMTDARDFFGRADLTQKLLERLCENDPYHRFLSIVGPSGSGKSSLVKAGLIPALWKGAIAGSEKWFVVDMIPGAYPLDKLETALVRVAANQAANLGEQLQRDERGLMRVADIILPADDTELVIVVDQFEEVFTLVEDETSRQQFLDLLQMAVSDVRSRVRVVVTLRADYYDRPLHYPEFGELMRNRMETVLPLTAKGLERAIRGPAERVGVVFEQGLVEQMVSAMNYQAGALPLMQYALTELFDRRDGRILTNAVYQQIGGAVGALANRADEIYSQLTDEAQELAHQLFMRLVTLGEGAEDTRRRATHAELLSLTENTDLMEEVIDQFAAYRLLSLDHDPETRQPTVEVAHEAILREWDRLRGWLNESRDDIRQERAVSRAADEWAVHGRDKSYLLRGARLEQVEKWQVVSSLIQTPLEQEFISQSLQQREKEEVAEIARQAREQSLEKRSQNTLRGLVAVMTVAAMIASVLAIFALGQRNSAEDARDHAELDRNNAQQSAAEFRSMALTFGAQGALDNGQPDVASALALEAINMDNAPLQSQLAFHAIVHSNWIQQRLYVSDTRVFDAIYHPDGQRILTTSWDGRAVLWDIETGRELQSIQMNTRFLFSAIHPDNQTVAIGSVENVVRLWNIDTGEVTELVIGENGQGGLAFTPDGTRLIMSSDPTTVNILDMANGEVIRSFEAHQGRFIAGLHVSDDGRLLSTASTDGFVKIWDMETGELVQSLDHNDIAYSDGFMWDSLFLRDGERMLTVGVNGVYLWNWQTGEVIWSIDEGANTQDIALSPDGRIFVVGLNDPNPIARLRDVETGTLIREYHGHGQRIQNVDFSPDGTTILTGSNDGTAAIWPVNGEGTVRIIAVHSSDSIVWHPTQPLIATVGIASESEVDSTIRLVDIRTGEIVRTFEGHRNVVGTLAFTPDGRYLLSGDSNASSTGDDERVYIWDVETGESVLELGGHEMHVRSIAVSPNGRIAAVGDSGGTNITLWNLETGEQIRILPDHNEWVTALKFSPDGQFLYSGGRDGTLFQWDMESSEIVRQFDGHHNAIDALDTNLDGTRLVSAGQNGTPIIWDTATGEALIILEGHMDAINVAEFSPDDRMIMTGSMDGRVILWDAETGERLRTYVVYDKPFSLYAAFSPDGQLIAASANDIITIFEVSLLPVDLQTWVAKNRHIPDFTCDQRALYVIEPLCEAPTE